MEHEGVKGLPALGAAEGMPVLLVTDTIIRWVIAALDKFGNGEGDTGKGKENFQGHFLPE